MTGGVRHSPCRFLSLTANTCDTGDTARTSATNGRATAPRVKLDRISIREVTERNLEARVARPGAQRENLRGLCFTERLSSC
jgi:predicted aspartyl protease